ncbi:MAG: G-D-S-L family lipolytic protein [Cyanobacteria bacterium RU_5_0]|nr:G-D-S-L family lipolytic protein [Cyanobacteria bacterium RU_5_0]
MAFYLVRNKRSVKRVDKRRFRSATHFFKFSPALLRLRLLPGWVFLSLAANGFLLAVLLLLLLRGSNPTTASPVPASTTTITTSVSLTASSPLPSSSSLGPRHQLNYQQWVDLLAQEAEVAAERNPDRLSILAGDSISLWFPENELPPERHWLNQGISGETSFGLLKRLDLFDQTQPETIFVMIGINDLLRGTEAQVILDNQQEIIRYLQEIHPQAQIVVQSMLPHAGEKATWEGRDRLLDLSNSDIRELNQELEAIAKQEGVYFLDLYSLFANSKGNLRMEVSTDGLHLNSQGYHVWSIALQVYSREVLEPDLRE